MIYEKRHATPGKFIFFHTQDHMPDIYKIDTHKLKKVTLSFKKQFNELNVSGLSTRINSHFTRIILSL